MQNLYLAGPFLSRCEDAKPFLRIRTACLRHVIHDLIGDLRRTQNIRNSQKR